MLCTSCMKHIVCDCSPNALDSPVLPCAKKKGAIWVHVTDDEGRPIPKASVTKNKGPAETKGSGIAAFDPLDAGAYAIDLGPLGTLAERYDRPTGETERKFDLSDGEVAYVAYELKRKAELTIRVVVVGTETPEEKPFPNAKVTIEKDGTVADETSKDDGLARFKLRSAGKYAVKVDPGEAGGHRYELAADNLREFELSPGMHKDDVVLKVLKPWVAIRLEHPDGDVLTDGADRKLMLKLPDGSEIEKPLAQANHNGDGFIKVEFFPAGECEAWFAGLDEAIWDAATSPVKPATYVPGRWEKPPADPYRIQAGDCIRNLAARFGLPEQYIWAHPDNKALHDEFRTDAHGDTLLPGREIRIPRPRETKKVKVVPGSQYRFAVKVEPWQMKVRLLRGSKPVAGTDFVVKIAGIADQKPLISGEGWLTFDIPPNASEAKVSPEKPDLPGMTELTFSLGRLPPVESVVGVQHRLSNLGLYAGPRDGLKSAKYDDALKIFQKWRGIEVLGSGGAGEIDEKTKDELVKACGA